MQAAAVLLGLDGDRMESIRLLKLIYIADREMLAEAGAPITGDRAVALKHGPAPSQVHRLIKGQAARAGEWADVIRTVNHNVEFRKPVGRGKLSRAEVEKLHDVTDRHRNNTAWELCDLTHNFPEWRDNYILNASALIPWEQALEAQGKANFIPAARNQAELGQVLDDLFGA